MLANRDPWLSDIIKAPLLAGQDRHGDAGPILPGQCTRAARIRLAAAIQDLLEVDHGIRSIRSAIASSRRSRKVATVAAPRSRAWVASSQISDARSRLISQPLGEREAETVNLRFIGRREPRVEIDVPRLVILAVDN
jgi:hypothetical protein